MTALTDKITEYLTTGDLWNPEEMDPEKVRDLLIECREELDRLSMFKETVWFMASKRLKDVDKYIMAAKQTVCDYEDRGGTYRD